MCGGYTSIVVYPFKIHSRVFGVPDIKSMMRLFVQSDMFCVSLNLGTPRVFIPYLYGELRNITAGDRRMILECPIENDCHWFLRIELFQIDGKVGF